MRLRAQAKMGYYPTPECVAPIIARFLTAKNPAHTRILDPCAGEGTAVKMIGEHLSAGTYGIELDLERGEKAREKLTKCLITDYQNTRISHNSFGLLYLNPPYDWSAKDDELGKSERYELSFLRHSISYLCTGGVLVYLIPQKRLDLQIARVLSYRFEQISVFRFPQKEYAAFKQLVIFGTLKKTPGKDDLQTERLVRFGQMKETAPFLPEDPIQTYEVPESPVKGEFVFRGKDIDADELAIEIRQFGLFDQFKELTTPLKMTEKIRPIMPLRHGHLAQILACGLMNGIVWDKDNKSPLLESELHPP